MSDINLDQQQAIEDAEAEGTTVVKGTPTRLLLDIDSDEQWKHFQAMLPQVAFNLSRHVRTTIKKGVWWRSKNKNRHVKLTLSKPLVVPWRVAIQALLGSDSRRELLTLCRLGPKSPEPSMLFRPAGAKLHNVPIQEWRESDIVRSQEAIDDDLPF